MHVRAATLADLAAMKGLASASPQAAQWGDQEWSRIFDRAAPVTRAVIAGEEGSAVCGFLVARILGRDWELENVVVARQVRRRGAARQLIKELIRLAESHQAAVIHLEVRESNHPARALYESCGFAESGRRKAYYVRPSEDAVLYRFSFSSPEK
jgi:ribosomal-protein-alanine N-acetyltransferase